MQQTEAIGVADTQNKGVSRALALGMLAANASGLVWFGLVAVTNRHLSVASILIGVAVAHAVLTGGGRGVRSQTISVAITLAALLVTEAFAIRLLAVREMVELGVTETLPVLLPFVVMKDLVSAGLTADPPTALFWGVALFYAISVPRRLKFDHGEYGFTR